MPLFDWLALQLQRLDVLLTQPLGWLALVLGVLGVLLVIISAFVRTMIPLRWLAVGSNVGFIGFGAFSGSMLLVVLHAVLLPVNAVRVAQMVLLTRRVRVRADAQQLELWLRPYMRSNRFRAGKTIFENGSAADRLYFLADGRIELPEVGRTLEGGQMFGEIAFFAPDGRRSSSARCVTDCTVLSIDEGTFRQLAYQNPAFGMEVMRLIAGRLSQDVQRLQAALPAPGGQVDTSAT